MEVTIKIEEGKELKFDNIASFRKKMKQTEIQLEIIKFAEVLKESGARKNGPMISVTYGVEQSQDEQVIDMEFLVPMDRHIELKAGYNMKSQFHLTNAIYSRHLGNQLDIENTYTQLKKYIEENQFQQITAAYNVNLNDGKLGETPIIDIYIGVNPNKL